VSPLTLTVLWGSAFLLTKMAVTGGLPPVLVVAGRLLVAVALGAVFLGEQPQMRQFAALLLILGGILVAQWERRRAPPAPGRTLPEQVPKRLGE
jgi:drug/metabolite transporter (DMT)-like permease